MISSPASLAIYSILEIMKVKIVLIMTIKVNRKMTGLMFKRMSLGYLVYYRSLLFIIAKVYLKNVGLDWHSIYLVKSATFKSCP